MDLAAFDQVRQLAAGQYLVGSLHAVTALGVADAFAESVTVSALAAAVKAEPEALGRVLRLLSSRGIFSLDQGRVSHTPASLLLRADHPASLAPLVRMFAGEIQWRAAEHVLDAVRIGEAVTPRLYDGGFWAYYQERPAEGRVFDGAMQAKAVAQIAGVLRCHDFSRYGRIVDAGGGQGHLLRAILAQHPGARGVLFDQPEVIEAARALGNPSGMSFVAGDFFAAVPEGDAIILMEVIHDWADAEAVRILETVRRAANPETRLLLIETEVPEGPEPHWSKLLDIVMLTQFGSLQRTRAQYQSLLEASRFEMTGAIDTGMDISVIEARPA
jgi:hypothetical protein